MGVGGLLAELPQRGRPRAGPAGEGGAEDTAFPTGEELGAEEPDDDSTAEDVGAEDLGAENSDAEDLGAENSDAAPFAAVVLAAGRGARMGAGEAPTKLLADFHGAPLVRRATEAALPQERVRALDVAVTELAGTACGTAAATACCARGPSPGRWCAR